MSVGVRSIDVAAPLFDGAVPPDAECPVCKCAMASAGLPLRRTACGHLFCGPCLETWLRSHALCPLCNHDLTEEGGAQEARTTLHGLLSGLADAFGRRDAPPPAPQAAMPFIAFSAEPYRAERRRPDRRPDELAACIARVNQIMDGAKAEVIAEVARALARSG